MTPPLFIESTSGSRRVGSEEFPLTIGGRDADIPLSDVDLQNPVAVVGMADGQLFLQSQGVAEVACNGTPVTTSQWLHDDDLIRIGIDRIRVRLEKERTVLVVEETPVADDNESPEIVAVPPTAPSHRQGAKKIRPVEFKPGRLSGARRDRRRVRPAALALWLVIPVLAIVGWLLLTARSVEIVIEPAPDTMAIDGGPVGLRLQMGGRRMLRPGSYRLVAAKEGFRGLDVPFEVSHEANQTVRFTLEKLPGLLIVETLAGAEVAIDGEVVGIAPLDPLKVEEGEHKLRITADRYDPYVGTVLIEGTGLTETVVAELIPRWAPVTFDSSPKGAAVRVDGDHRGVTPLTSELLEGRHRIDWVLEGHKPRGRSIDVVADEPLVVPTVTLELTDGRLVVNSEPSGVTVTVNDVYRGQTPLELYMSPGDEAVVEVSEPGHEPASEKVRIVSGRTRTVNLVLARRFGEVEIKADPVDAEVWVDGALRGNANQTFSLVAVPHQIEIRRDGYEPHRATVVPRPGVGQTIEVRLKTAEEIKAESQPNVIHTAAGQELVLIHGGRFRMGASRREPGRRANETLRDVELARPFYFGTREITNREFREFKSQHLSGEAEGFNLENDHHPAVRVSWDEAATFCNWLSRKESLPPAYELKSGKMVAVRPLTTGYRLPTEAEWAWAARYAGGATPRKYPWGDSLPVKPGSANYADESVKDLLDHSIAGFDDGYPTTAPAGSFEPNALGLFNLGGNVAEWVHDIYTIHPSGADVAKDPTGPGDGELHVIRGASWMDSSVSELRLTYRDYGDSPRPDVGFRIARYAE